MLKKILVAYVLLYGVSVLAQDAAPPNSYPSGPMRPGRRGGMPPCLQQAGLDRSTVARLRSIQQDARSQVEGVCSNSSLTPQQKREQVRDIHQQAHQKIESFITPEQQKAIATCRSQRSPNHPGMGDFEGVGGGCAEWEHSGPRPGGANGPANTGNGNQTPPPPNQ